MAEPTNTISAPGSAPKWWYLPWTVGNQIEHNFLHQDASTSTFAILLVLLAFGICFNIADLASSDRVGNAQVYTGYVEIANIVYMLSAMLVIRWARRHHRVIFAIPHDGPGGFKSYIKNYMPLIVIWIFFGLSALLDFGKILADCEWYAVYWNKQGCKEYRFDQVVDVIFHFFRMVFLGYLAMFATQIHGCQIKGKRIQMRYGLMIVFVAALVIWFDAMAKEIMEHIADDDHEDDDDMEPHQCHTRVGYSTLLAYIQPEFLKNKEGKTDSILSFYQTLTKYLRPFNIEFLILISEILAQTFFLLPSPEEDHLAKRTDSRRAVHGESVKLLNQANSFQSVSLGSDSTGYSDSDSPKGKRPEKGPPKLKSSRTSSDSSLPQQDSRMVIMENTKENKTTQIVPVNIGIRRRGNQQKVPDLPKTKKKQKKSKPKKPSQLKIPISFVLGTFCAAIMIITSALHNCGMSLHLYMMCYNGCKVVYYSITIAVILWAFYLSQGGRDPMDKLTMKVFKLKAMGHNRKHFKGMEMLVLFSSIGVYGWLFSSLFAFIGYLRITPNNNGTTIENSFSSTQHAVFHQNVAENNSTPKDPEIPRNIVGLLILCYFIDMAVTFIKSIFLFYCTKVTWIKYKMNRTRQNSRLTIEESFKTTSTISTVDFKSSKHKLYQVNVEPFKQMLFKECILFIAIESICCWFVNSFFDTAQVTKEIDTIQAYFYEDNTSIIVANIVTPFCVFFNFNAFFILLGAYLE